VIRPSPGRSREVSGGENRADGGKSAHDGSLTVQGYARTSGTKNSGSKSAPESLKLRSAYLTVAPDWACEVVSPSTEDVDRAEKMPIYAREGVAHLWLVDPLVKTLEVFRLDGASYRVVHTWRGNVSVRAEPFDAIELDLSILWAT
jgi:hypothetical protein